MSTTVVEDPTDVIEPQVEALVIRLSEGTENELVLVQRPLTFFGKLEFFSVVGKAIESALGDGVSIAELLEVPDRQAGAPLSAETFKEADTFAKAVANLIQYVPEILLDLYCVVFAVPRHEREYVKMRMEHELTDEQGFQVLDRFLDQNWDVLTSFFTDRILPLVSKVSGKVRNSASSKPSKATRQTTRKASKTA